MQEAAGPTNVGLAAAERYTLMSSALRYGRTNQVHEQSMRVKELEERLSGLQSATVCALNQLLDLKDLNTGVHSTRLAEWAVRIARDLDLQDEVLRDIEVAALLHDIGKMGVADSILKKPGRLTDDEYAIMKKHPEYGWSVVRLFPH